MILLSIHIRIIIIFIFSVVSLINIKGVNDMKAVTLALLAFYCAPSAAESSLMLYGVADMGISSTHANGPNGTKQKLTGITSGGLDDSLIGMIGREALSNGWSATFQLESVFDGATGTLDDDGDHFFGNAAWLGLGNNQFGELRLGRQHTVGQEFGSELEIASWKDMGMGATFMASDDYSVNNSVNYFSPAWAGLRFGASYSFDVLGEQRNGQKSPSYSAAILYEIESFAAVATWDKTFISDRLLADAPHPEAWQLGVSYDFEVAKVSVAWSRQKNGYAGLNGGDPSGLGLGLGTAEFAQGGRLDAYLLGVAIPVTTNGTAVAQWSLVKPNWDWANGEKAENGQVATLGYVHQLSPRTSLYAMAGIAKRYSLEDQVVQGQGTTTRYMAGMSHNF